MDEQRPSGKPDPEHAATGGEPLPPPPDLSAGRRPWSPTPAAQARPVDPGIRKAALMVVAGAGLVVVGVVLPWLKGGSAGEQRSVTGLDAHEWWVLILAAIAIVRASVLARDPATVARTGRQMPTVERIVLGIAIDGGILAYVLFSRYRDINDAIRTVESQVAGADYSIGLGFWLAVLGTVLLLAACLFAYVRARR